jgi:uncharacterized cupredoxin-like copper-binding protein
MKLSFILCMILVIPGVLCAGCTYTSPAGQSGTVTTAPTAVANVTAVVTVAQPTLSLGAQYLQNSYSFSGQNSTFNEQIRIADPSWAITYSVTNLSSTPQESWFAMTVTNLDTQKNQTFTWTYLNETYQQYPMYTPGLYQFAMTGTLVKVDLTVAKRLP